MRDGGQDSRPPPAREPWVVQLLMVQEGEEAHALPACHRTRPEGRLPVPDEAGLPRFSRPRPDAGSRGQTGGNQGKSPLGILPLGVAGMHAAPGVRPAERGPQPLPSREAAQRDPGPGGIGEGAGQVGEPVRFGVVQLPVGGGPGQGGPQIHEGFGQRATVVGVEHGDFVVRVQGAAAEVLEDAPDADHAVRGELGGPQGPMLAAPTTATPSASSARISLCRTGALWCQSPSLISTVSPGPAPSRIRSPCRTGGGGTASGRISRTRAAGTVGPEKT